MIYVTRNHGHDHDQDRHENDQYYCHDYYVIHRHDQYDDHHRQRINHFHLSMSRVFEALSSHRLLSAAWDRPVDADLYICALQIVVFIYF